MKKLLAILASVTLVSSSSAAVVSCASDEVTNHLASNYINNNFNNILASSLEKAKSVIINNEYGIDQSKVSDIQQLIKASDDFKDLDTSKLGKDATVKDLVTKYYGNNDYTNADIKSTANIDLSGTNGVDSGFDYLLKQLFSTLKFNPVISNALLRGKDSVIGLLQTFEKTVDSANLNLLNHSIYNTGISGSEFLINTGITIGINALNGKIDSEKNDDGTDNTSGIFHKIGQVINTVIANKNEFAESTLPNFFTSDTMKLIKQVMSDIFDKHNPNGNIQDVIYQNKTFTLPNFSYKKPSDNTPSDNKQLDDKDDNPQTIFYSLDAGVSQIKDIKFVDIKKEFLASADRIVNLILDWTKMGYKAPVSAYASSDYLTTANADLSNKLSWLISQLISNKGFKVLTNKIDQQAIQGFVVEGLRLVTIMNAQFSMLEDTMDVTPKDTKHLFSNDLTNYQFFNNQDSSKGKVWTTATLGDSTYVKAPNKDGDGKSEPININYFISNLNYYLGGLGDADQSGTYNIQKFLFLVMNDPCDLPNYNPNDDNVWVDKKSDILDFIVKVGMNVAKDIFANKTDDTSQKVSAALNGISDADVETLENMIIKPLFLGLLNGNSMRPLIESAITGFDWASDNIADLKTILDGLKTYGINIENIKVALNRLKDNDKFMDDTFHSLFTEDFRNVIDVLPFIPQKYIDEFFGPDEPVNLRTIANFPLFKILAMLNVPGFIGGKIPTIGDAFTTKTVPELLNVLNKALNKNLVDGYKNLPTKYAVYKKDSTGKDTDEVDYENSLKAYDINAQAIYDLFISIVGDGNDERDKPYDPTADTAKTNNNIFSKLLKDLIKTPEIKVTTDKDGKKIYPYKVPQGIQLDPATAVTDLGFAGQVSKKTNDSNKTQFDDVVPTIADGQTTDNKVFTFKTTNIADSADVKDKITIDKLPEGATVESASVKDNVLTVTLNKAIDQTDKEQDFTLTYKVDDNNSLTAKMVVAPKAVPVKLSITNVTYTAGSTTINADTTGIPDGDVKDKISITSGPFGGDAQISSATVASNKLTITLVKALTNETENDKVEKITYKDGGDSTTATFTVKAKYVGGTDLQFTPQSVVGAFSRIILPEIDANKYDDGDATYTVHDSYFNVDLLSHVYQNFINLILDLNAPGYYGDFIKKILDTKQAFEIDYNPESIKYFQSDRNLIKGFTFVVTYKNYTVGQTNKYLFTVSRNSNIEGFKINSLITDKHN